jgi:hypothetical protein
MQIFNIRDLEDGAIFAAGKVVLDIEHRHARADRRTADPRRPDADIELRTPVVREERDGITPRERAIERGQFDATTARIQDRAKLTQRHGASSFRRRGMSPAGDRDGHDRATTLAGAPTAASSRWRAPQRARRQTCGASGGR